jgi:hypothetical protein
LRRVVDLTDPPLTAAKFIMMEMDFAREGGVMYNAGAAVIDMGCVRMQMLVLHGCAKITRDARSA